MRVHNALAADYGAKRPNALAKITDDLDMLLGFVHFPAEHWIHMRPTTPIEYAVAETGAV